MKKFLCLICALSLLVCTLASCGNSEINPFDIVDRLNAEDYYVWMVVDEEEIKEFLDELELGVRTKGIQYTIYAEPNDYYDERAGVFIFCEDKNSAQKLEEDLNDALEYYRYEEDAWPIRCTVERTGILVFYGCEDAWEDMWEDSQ